MLIQLKMFDTNSKCIETTYDEVPLRYLLMYIMGRFNESIHEIAIDNDELAEILVCSYSQDFWYSNISGDVLIIDILDNWECYCGIWNIISSISYFQNETFEKYILKRKSEIICNSQN